MKISRLITLSLALLVLAGCKSMGLESKRVDYKSDSAEVPTLEVPPDLTVPAAEEHYLVPGEGGTASYSEYYKGAEMARSNAVLPVPRNVRMEHEGAKRWLVVDDRAENIWPVIKAFFMETGFNIKSENPQAGVLETDWAENRAKIPRTGLRSVLGKVVDGLYDSGEKDRYVVRLERSKDAASTLVYLTQYGTEEVLSADKSTSVWQARPNDPELEATMLQMLMARLGGAEEHGMKTAQGDKPSAQAPSSPPKMQTLSDGSQGIWLSEPFDKSWRVVGLALERAGFAVEDKDRTGGIYFLRARKAEEKHWYDKLAFWSSDEESAPTRSQVTVRESNGGCEVGANDGTGATNEETQGIIDALFKALGK